MDQQRRWALIGLFGGAVVMIGTWLVLSGAPSTTNAVGVQEVRDARAKGRHHRPSVDPVGRDVRNLHDRAGAVKVVGLPDIAPGAGQRPQGQDGVYDLDQDGVAAAVKSQLSEIRACYETALFHTPDLAGSMTLELQITPVEGEEVARIESVDVETDIDATIFEGCVTTVFEDLRFRATEPTVVRYPLSFDAGGEGEDEEQVAGAAPGAGQP